MRRGFTLDHWSMGFAAARLAALAARRACSFYTPFDGAWARRDAADHLRAAMESLDLAIRDLISRAPWILDEVTS